MTVTQSPLCANSEISCNTLGTVAISLGLSTTFGACAAYLLAIPAGAGALFGLTAAATNAALDWAFGPAETTLAKIVQVALKFLLSAAAATAVTVAFGFTLTFKAGLGLSLVTLGIILGVVFVSKMIREGFN